MADYYLYILDGRDHVRRRVDLECRDDEHAIMIAGDYRRHDAMELWSGDRLVKRFEPLELGG